MAEKRTAGSKRWLVLRAFAAIRSGLRRMFALREGTDAAGTISEIRSGVETRGANFWILICGAGLASIGLDINSAAVIIGAMLISPLMNPILGIGLAVGINDRHLLFNALKNFSLAVGISLAVSTLYFLITPLGEPTAELTARTVPTLLDVGVAIFGGTAGVVAGSRTQKTHAIPGVAIATALMPPLCTAGFGLATGRWDYLGGALYLFHINATFIAISTYMMVRFLHFPYRKMPDETTRTATRGWITAFVIATAIPSAFIFYDVIRDLQTNRMIKSFVRDQLTAEYIEPVRWEVVDDEDGGKLLKVFMIGTRMPDRLVDSHAVELRRYGLEDYALRLIQTDIPKSEVDRLTEQAASSVLNAMELRRQADAEKERTIDSLERVLERVRADTLPITRVAAELQTVLPEISSISYSRSVVHPNDTTPRVPLFLIEYRYDYSPARREMVHGRLVDYLKTRLELDTFRVQELSSR